MLNCADYPVYVIPPCFSQLILAFPTLEPDTDYIVEFTNNLNQVYRIDITSDSNGEILFAPNEYVNDLFSPFLVRFYKDPNCPPVIFTDCLNNQYTQFELRIEKYIDQENQAVVIPCCND